MFITEHISDARQKEPTVKTMKTKQEVIAFVANRSDDDKFQLIMINEYKSGQLFPMEMQFINGRLQLVNKQTDN